MNLDTYAQLPDHKMYTIKFTLKMAKTQFEWLQTFQHMTSTVTVIKQIEDVLKELDNKEAVDKTLEHGLGST